MFGSAAFSLLQPLSIAARLTQQSPGSVLVWFQAAYLAGFVWALATARLHSKHDAALQLGALIAVLIIAAGSAGLTGSQQLLALLPLAAWLAACSTVVLRLVSGTMLTGRAWWVLAAANLGAMAGLLAWLLSGDAIVVSVAWRWLGASLATMALTFLILVCLSWRLQSRGTNSVKVAGAMPSAHAMLAWLVGSAAASAALVWVTQAASERLPEVASDRLAATHLAAFLWAHAVVWLLHGCAVSAATRALCAAFSAVALAAVATALLHNSAATATSVVVHLFCSGCVAWIARHAPGVSGRTLFMGCQATAGFVGGTFAAWMSG